jgi:hypothetical protein
MLTALVGTAVTATPVAAFFITTSATYTRWTLNR